RDDPGAGLGESKRGGPPDPLSRGSHDNFLADQIVGHGDFPASRGFRIGGSNHVLQPPARPSQEWLPPERSLARREKPVLVDTHLHLIDKTRLAYPWLAGEPALDRDFLY